MFYWVLIIIFNIVIPWPFNWILKTAHLAWFYSFQCFEYRCYYEKKTIGESADWVEKNWLYFLGFGTFMAVVIP